MDDKGFLKDIALLAIGAVAGLAPWLLDKVGIEMPKPIYVCLLLLSASLVGWALQNLGWVEKIPILRDKRISLSTSLICGIVLTFSVWLVLRGVEKENKYDYRKWQSDKNEIVSRHFFHDEVVEIDGKTFDHCKFSNVTLLYHGVANTTLLEPQFEGDLVLKSDNQAVKGMMLLESSFRNNPNVMKFGVGEIDANGNVRTIEQLERKQPTDDKQAQPKH